MNAMDLSQLKLLADALKAAQRGDRIQSLELAERYGIESAATFASANPEGLAMIISPLIRLYQMLGDWELVALKSKDVCALAEKCCPNTTETGGDYTHLATALEKLGDYTGAINALENSARHLKGAGTWETYAARYENKITQLRQNEARGQPSVVGERRSQLAVTTNPPLKKGWKFWK